MFKQRKTYSLYDAPKRSRRPGTLLTVLLTAAWWTLVFDIPYWTRLAQAAPDGSWQIPLVFGTFLFLMATTILMVLSFLPRPVFKGLLTVLAALGGTACCGELFYGTVMTPNMMRNVLATNSGEMAGYFSLRTVFWWMVISLPPMILAWLCAPKRRDIRWGWLMKAAGALLAFILGIAMVALNFQDFAGINRSDRTLRYYIAPLNVIWSTGKTFVEDDNPDEVRDRLVLDDAPTMTITPKDPTVFVVMVGETTRAANWGLSGYERDTTPELKTLDVINFTDLTSCGTSTDVSVPCMMSRVGRANYDRKQILKEEALPALLKRAGFDVIWVDNQGGCKGACQGVTSLSPKMTEEYCASDNECLDGVFIPELQRILAGLKPEKPTVVFFHMMGAHGPKYFERSDAARKAFLPECDDADLTSCERSTIVNAFDNSVRYSDWVMASLIREMKARPHLNAGLLYMSDHGESLGEKGLYLHGAPLMVAPKEQTHIPGFLWMNPAFQSTYQVNLKALDAKKDTALSHDNLFSTVLGLLKVKTKPYDAKLDITSSFPEK